MFKLGTFLRHRYDDFLTNNIKEVKVRSSDKNRCLESAHLTVNGAYKIKKSKKFVPIHTTNYESDSVCSFTIIIYINIL